VQLLASAPDRADQVGCLEDGEVLSRRLARHVDAIAQLSERLPVVLAQRVQEVAPRRIGKGLEHQIHRQPVTQVNTCMSSRAAV
jgi:hypothetical protein